MSTPAPELPRRTPGLVGNEFEQLAPPGPACFECERHPAAFELAAQHETALGSIVASSFRLCELCVGQTAAALPVDVVVFITRLRKNPSS